MSKLWIRLKAILAPPHFADEETNLQAAILNAITLVVAFLVPLFLIVVSLLNADYTTRVARSSLFNVALALSTNGLMRLRRVRAASLIFVIGYIFKLYVIAWLTRGAFAPPLIGTMIALFWAGFLLERWLVLALTVLTIAVGFGFAYLGDADFFPFTWSGYSAWSFWLLVVNNIVVLMITQQIIAAVLRKAHYRVTEEVHVRRLAECELQRLSNVKDEFLVNLSHELRTPLTSIKGYAEVLQEDVLDRETQDFAVQAIVRNASHQEAIVDDLLDLSRIINGTIEISPQPVVPQEALREAIANFAQEASNKQVTLNLKADDSLDLIAADPHRLQQILGNLLSNAIKFSAKGGLVEMILGRDEHWSIITITDHGVGIPASYLPHMFERFSQADSSRSREHGGLGIGLAITKTLVALHKGTISVHSAGLGCGASFVVKFPRLMQPRHAEADMGRWLNFSGRLLLK